MRKRLSLTLLVIIFGFALITPTETTAGVTYNLSTNYDRAYTFDVEHAGYRSTHTLYTSVPLSLYDYYHSETHQINGERDYAQFVTPDAVRTIAENMRKIASNGPHGDEEFANDVLALVRQIPYSISGQKYPVEALVDNSGDCDVLSFLVASIMKAGGLDVVLLVYRNLPGSHMNVGVYLPYKPLADTEIEPVGFTYGNRTYWVAECTPVGIWEVGHQSETFANANTTIIPLENCEDLSPAPVSSSLEDPLLSSSISITMSSANSSTPEKWRSLTISGSIFPVHSGEKVVLYISQDRSSCKVFQTRTDRLGNYSLTWNVTSTGTYYIRASLVPFLNYAGADSDLMTFVVGPYPAWDENGESLSKLGAGFDGMFPSSVNARYKGVDEFLKSDLVGANVSLSGEFMLLNTGQNMTTEPQTITIPETQQTIKLSRRRTITITLPERKLDVQGGEQTNNQFGFVLENNGGNFSASVRLLNYSDAFYVENRLGGNNATFMNVSASIDNNVWYKAVAKVTNDKITTELRGENDTLLKTVTVEGDAVDIDSSGILISCEPYTFVAFKNLRVENLDAVPDPLVSNVGPPANGFESLVPYFLALVLLVLVGAIAYLKKTRDEKAEKT
jgi:hypothetical protein